MSHKTNMEDLVEIGNILFLSGAAYPPSGLRPEFVEEAIYKLEQPQFMHVGSMLQYKGPEGCMPVYNIICTSFAYN